MNPDVYNPKSGIYVLEILAFGADDSSMMIIDAINIDITLNDIYEKIYGDRFSFLQGSVDNAHIIKNIRFIPHIWKDIF
jgi:hypothetical protein